MDLLREKLKAHAAARLLGGGGGGGGGGGDIGDGVSPSAGPGAGPGAPGTGPSSNSDVGAGNTSPGASGGMPGIGLGVTNPSTIGLGMMGMLAGLPVAGLNATATVGNAINAATGFGGGTPSADTSAPGGFMTPTGWVPAQTFGEQQLDYDPRIANIMGIDYARSIFQQQQQPAFPGFGFPAPAAPAAPAPMATPAAPPGAPAAPTASGSPEEQALRQAQLELVQQQRSIATEMLRRQNLLEGEMMRSQGMEPVTDEAGNIVGYRPTAENQRLRDSEAEINNLMRTRTLAALKGELPVDPALERSIAENRATLEATLRGNLGSGYATSTPGMQSLADFDKRAEELRVAQRRDQLTTGEGLRLAGEDLNNRVSSARFGNIVGLSGVPAAGAGILSTAGAGLTPGLQNILGNTGMTLQDIISGRSNDTNRWLGQLDADTRRYIAQLTGVNSANELNRRAEIADNAGTGQLLGSLGAAFINNPGSFGSILGGLSDFGGSIIDGIGSLFGG